MTSDEMESTHWKNSRHGAWASGGFHYQHLIAVYLLLRQWNKQDPTGGIIPEGFDDISIEYPDNNLWVQVKSRNSGYFSENEIEAIHLKSLEKAKTVTGSASKALVVSERPIKGKEADRLEVKSLGSTKHLYCDDPLSSIIKTIQEKTDVLEGTAFNIAICLHFWISSVARKNGHSEYKKRTKITQSDLEAKIQNTIESGDIDYLDKIIENRILVPVDFITPIEDHHFYTGVKVQPGHISAGLVFDRPDDVTKCHQLIDKTQQLLITAPSGSGKSALMWLVAKTLSEKITWYRTSSMTGVLNLEQVMCFVRVFKPSLSNPLGIIVDDVAQENFTIWNSLSDELSLIPGCYLLGSARTENRALIKPNNLLQNNTPELSEALAQELWTELQNRNLTSISHWKESFEQSRGLILEYMHILTQGETLRSTIGSQIHVREQEGRLDEIKILRTASLEHFHFNLHHSLLSRNSSYILAA